MPKLVDYCARHGLLREAHDELILEHGIRALTLTAVAERVGISLATMRRIVPDLDGLHQSSYLWRIRRRAYQRLLYKVEMTPFEAAVHCVERLLPLVPKSRDEITVMRAIESIAVPGSKLAEAIAGHLDGELTYLGATLDLLGESDEIDRLRLVSLTRGLTEALLQARVDEDAAREVVRRHLAEFAATARESGRVRAGPA